MTRAFFTVKKRCYGSRNKVSILSGCNEGGGSNVSIMGINGSCILIGLKFEMVHGLSGVLKKLFVITSCPY